MEKSEFKKIIYTINKRHTMEKSLLEKEYDRCLRSIIQASEYITKMTLDEDVERVDLYRTFLNEMVDRAIQIKKLKNL
jgi:hypothetical protein